VAVMGHVGLTPQAISVIGGFRAQGRTGVKARALLDDALALQDAGACAVVLECMPAQVGKVISESLEIPTIGIGAGPHTHGQVCRAFQVSLSGQRRCSAHTLEVGRGGRRIYGASKPFFTRWSTRITSPRP